MTVPMMGSGGVIQPWNQIVWPGMDSGEVRAPMSPARARALPAIGRVIGLITGMIKQMPLENYTGEKLLDRPRLLDQPDPTVSRAWWVGMHAEDYLLNGNAIGLVTVRDSFGWPLTVAWIPAEWVAITWTEDRRGISYWVGGYELPVDDVIHIRRGADRWCPHRGVGLVEQHLQQLGKVDDQERYERNLLNNSAIPSVTITVPNPEITQDVADEARRAWTEKYGGPNREPAVLPNGTVVTPLAWSPTDAQMVEARKLSLVDVANMANLDGYWVGAPSGSFTYKSPGPMYLNLLRQTINPITVDFEGEWSLRFLPRGRHVRFDRSAVLRDDMQTMISTADKAVKAGLWTKSEARAYIGWSAEVPAELRKQPVPEQLANSGGSDDDDEEGEDDDDDADAA